MRMGRWRRRRAGWGAELLRRGRGLATTGLLIAAAARLHRHVLVTRDADFQRVPGLAVETY